jgi:hypothetical protein
MTPRSLKEKITSLFSETDMQPPKVVMKKKKTKVPRSVMGFFLACNRVGKKMRAPHLCVRLGFTLELFLLAFVSL